MYTKIEKQIGKKTKIERKQGKDYIEYNKYAETNSGTIM